MANEFSKEERVAFEDMCAGFEDALVMSKAVAKYPTDGTEMERSNDTIWRPYEYIMTSKEGADQTGEFKDKVQLSVPAQITRRPVVTYNLTSTELRDMLQSNRMYDASKVKLASDINVAVQNTAALLGSKVVAVSTDAKSSGYGAFAECDSILTEVGVPQDMRYLGISSRDYNGLADNVQGLSRSFGDNRSDDAFERSLVGNKVAGFDALKLDYAYRLTAAAGTGITMDTQTAAGNYLIPAAESVAATGERSNVDNRFQTITVSSTTGVKQGDAFTIDGVESVHAITKESTGELQTFRVVSVDSGTTMTITPPLITTQGATEAEEQYQNCEVSAPNALAPINFLNVKDAYANPFWHRDSIEILPGTLVIDPNSGAGVMKASTENGYELCMTKQHKIETSKTLYRVEVRFGTVNLNPEMNGILLFNQSP